MSFIIVQGLCQKYTRQTTVC